MGRRALVLAMVAACGDNLHPPDPAICDPGCDAEAGQICVAGHCELACEQAATELSYLGCEYWAADLDNANVPNLGAAGAQPYSIWIATATALPATVTVTVDDAAGVGSVVVERVVASLRLEPGESTMLDFDPRSLDCASDPTQDDGSHSCLSSRAFHVTSTAPVVAYQTNPRAVTGAFSSDASLLLPVSALDSSYVVLGWPQTVAATNDPETNIGIDLRAFLTIVGTVADTHVHVVLSTAIAGGDGIAAAGPGDALDFVIGPYDVINLETNGFGADFSGTRVTADHGVAVFSGAEAADVPLFTSLADRKCCAEHMEEQLFPEVAFGMDFVAVKTPRRSLYVFQAGWDVAPAFDLDWWRIVASRDGTVVTTSLPAPSDQISLSRGDVATFSSDRDFVLHASAPVTFAQFPASQVAASVPATTPDGARPPGGDPSMVLVPPLEQWRSEYVFLVPEGYAFDFLLIAAPADADLVLDGQPLDTMVAGCETNPTDVYVARRCRLSDPRASDPKDPSRQRDGRHVLASTKPFGLVLYGWDSFVGYGFPAGANVRPTPVL